MLDKMFPKEELKGKFKFPVSFRELFMSDLTKIKQEMPVKIHGLGLNVWDRIVQHNLRPVNPMSIAQSVNSGTPDICEKIGEVTGDKIIKDIYYAECKVSDPILTKNTCAEFMVAHVFPNNIHLTDVMFADPYKPLAKELRKYRLQEYVGLGLLGVLIERMLLVGKEMGCDYIFLSAATMDLIPKFERHGFNVENTWSAKQAILFGIDGIPMERKIN